MGKQIGNGAVLKIIAGALISLFFASVVWIWNAAGICKDVESNMKKINEIAPKVDTNHDAILVMKRDIAQILSAQEKLARTEEENTKAIIEAINRRNGD